ncbi:anti-sigma factor [Modestobacter sp. VKM Ac-2983]|uniref:anti-sigma factor n=1 Tax=Modestobacter sp. VKM Ac-2983 TaxID=3004137 RepID=UPI0022ABBED1|nr:anti-sigma factor [Modestobacter sp. VKM Ac-2983]MCZ2803497.1 anti-sigma factor [Modestobacter sp. VKM Ac-2983]
MQHCDPDELALAALGEQPSPECAAHLTDCAECEREVTSLRRSVDVLAVPALATPRQAVAPPPQVWAAIAAATGVAVSPRPAEVEAGLAREIPMPRPAQAETATAGTVDPEPAGSTVLPFRPRSAGRPASRWLPLAAAVLVGGVIGAGAVAVTQDGAGGAVVAQAGLDPLPEQIASGTAEVRDRGGVRELQVDLDVPALDDAYYEVWLLQADAQRMVPVGIVQQGATVLPLPDGIDLAAYPLVDVSVEPLDGDPTHSGVSVVRGELST